MTTLPTSLAKTRPFSQQFIRWALLALCMTLLVEGLLFACHRWIYPINLTWGLELEAALVFFFFSLFIIARRCAKQASLSRQLIKLLTTSLETSPNKQTQQELHALQTLNDLNLGFAVLVSRLANGCFKLALLTFIIHFSLRLIFG